MKEKKKHKFFCPTSAHVQSTILATNSLFLLFAYVIALYFMLSFFRIVRYHKKQSNLFFYSTTKHNLSTESERRHERISHLGAEKLELENMKKIETEKLQDQQNSKISLDTEPKTTKKTVPKKSTSDKPKKVAKKSSLKSKIADFVEKTVQKRMKKALEEANRQSETRVNDQLQTVNSPKAKYILQMVKAGISLENATRYAEKIEKKGMVSHEQADALIARQKKKFPEIKF